METDDHHLLAQMKQQQRPSKGRKVMMKFLKEHRISPSDTPLVDLSSAELFFKSTTNDEGVHGASPQKSARLSSPLILNDKVPSERIDPSSQTESDEDERHGLLWDFKKYEKGVQTSKAETMSPSKLNASPSDVRISYSLVLNVEDKVLENENNPLVFERGSNEHLSNGIVQTSHIDSQSETANGTSIRNGNMMVSTAKRKSQKTAENHPQQRNMPKALFQTPKVAKLLDEFFPLSAKTSSETADTSISEMNIPKHDFELPELRLSHNNFDKFIEICKYVEKWNRLEKQKNLW